MTMYRMMARVWFTVQVSHGGAGGHGPVPVVKHSI